VFRFNTKECSVVAILITKRMYLLVRHSCSSENAARLASACEAWTLRRCTFQLKCVQGGYKEEIRKKIEKNIAIFISKSELFERSRSAPSFSIRSLELKKRHVSVRVSS